MISIRPVHMSAEALENRTMLSAPHHSHDPAPASHHVPSVVYVQSNNPNPGQNAVLAFRRNPVDGSLKELKSGPFLTGGTGELNASELLGPDDSDKELIASPDGKLLFTVNQGSNSIAVFRIERNGSLDLVRGAPFASGGVQPVSLSLSGNRLYVVNRGDEIQGQPGTVAPNYTAFTVNRDGSLVPIPGSTVTLPVGLSPSQALISPNGKFLFGDNFTPPPLLNVPLSNTIDPFIISADGKLVPAPGGPVGAPVTPPLLLGLAAHPTQNIVYAGLVGAARIGVYTYDDTGSLTFVRSVADQGRAPCWAIVSADGKYLYTSDSGSDSVGVFSLADPLNPVEIQEFALNGPSHENPDPTPATFDTVNFALALDPSGRFLYTVNHEVALDNNFPQGDAIHTLAVAADGTLSESSSSPLILPQSQVPANAHPQGIVVLGGKNRIEDKRHDGDNHQSRHRPTASQSTSPQARAPQAFSTNQGSSSEIRRILNLISDDVLTRRAQR